MTKPNANESLQREIDAKAQGTRSKIVAAALAEFAAHGKEGARIDRIAKSALVNKAMIYYHFESKDNLYREVLISFYRRVGERGRQTVLKADSLEESLLALAQLHAESVLESEEIVPLVLREMASPHPEIIQAIADVFTSAGLPGRIVSLLQQAMAEGKIRQVDLRQAMVTFVSMSLGYMVIAPMANRIFDIPDRRAFIKERPRVIVDIFLNGLKAK